MEWSRSYLKCSDCFFLSLLVKEVFRAGKPHLDCLSFCTEVLFNHYPPVKQLDVLPSDSAYPSVYPDDPASWWFEGPEQEHSWGGTLYLSLMIFSYLCHHLPTTVLFFFFGSAKTNPSEFIESALCIYSHLDAAQHTKTNTTHRHISYQGNTN